MRWLLVKDLQILRRSPLLAGLLVVYPIAISLMIGFALSSPPGKPKIAFYSAVAPGRGKITVGGQQISFRRLFQSLAPITARSRADAVAKVRDGQALAALIVPDDVVDQLQALVSTGVGSPTVELVLNSRDPIERSFAEQAIRARLNDVEQEVSRQVLRVALSDLQQVLDGGTIHFFGQSFPLLGLRSTRTILRGTTAALPRASPLRPGLARVIAFAGLAIEGLRFAGPVLGSIGSPLTIDRTQLAGRSTPAASYGAAIAVVVSLMFVTLLLAAGMLALERSEHAYPRLVRGLVSPGRLLSEKIAFSAGCAGTVTLVMAVLVSLFVHLDWARSPLWVVAVGLGALAFGALGVAIGALARDLSTASLMAFLVSLPIAFVALVPAGAVSGAVGSALDAVAFVFPFKASLQAVSNAFSGAAPGIGWPLVHLAVLTLAFGAIGRVALRRFG